MNIFHGTRRRWPKLGAITVARLCLSLAIASAGSLAAAGSIPWKKENFKYVAQGKALREFLQEFGASQGLVLSVEKDIEGTVNGKFDMKPENLLTLMAANFGFTWYYDGSILSVTNANDVRTEVIRLGEGGAEEMQRTLQRLMIADKRFPISYDARQGTALVSGPKRYVELVVQAARAAETGTPPSADVRVVLLRYASAADVVVNSSGERRVVPGLASLMTQVHGRSQAASTVVPSRPATGATRMKDLLSSSNVLRSLAGEDRDREREPSVAPQASVRSALALTANGDAGLPSFSADMRTNAVIVRDRPENLSRHEAAIRALDVKKGLVEIEARIIVMNSDDAEALGVDWRAGGRRYDLRSGGTGFPRPGWGSEFSSATPALGTALPESTVPLGGSLTTVLSDAGRFLITRVTALAEQGRAKVLSSPKILTLENIEAQLDDLESFFVRAQGAFEVDVFNVSAGTSLRVTPTVVDDNGEPLVRLQVRIEDGALTERNVEGLPVVRRSSISTHAMIAEGQALLIAGHAREVETNNEQGVPGLSKVPVLGWLFKSTGRSSQRVERFFLLTPRVVAPTPALAPTPPPS